jgi:hypothetical protein
LARDNYSYQKYQRELAKKKKKEEKMLRKLNKKKAQDGEPSVSVSNDDAPLI